MTTNYLRYAAALVLAIAAIALSAGQGLAQQSPTTPVPEPSVPGTGSTGSGGNGQTTQSSFDPPATNDTNAGGGAAAVSSRARFGQAGGNSVDNSSDPGAPAVGFGGAGTGPTRSTKVVSNQAPLGLRVTTREESGSHEPYLDRDVVFGDVPSDGEPMSMSSYDDGEAMPLLTFLDELHQATGWNIIPSPGLENMFVRFWIQNMSPRQALEVLRIHDIYYEYDSDTQFLYVRGVDEVKREKFGEILDAEFKLRYADILDMETILKNLASPRGRVVAEPRTGRLFVWDTEDNIGEMKEVVAKLDIPVDPQTFTLSHANVLDIEDSIPEFLSERGVAFTDPRTNSITITDQPERVHELTMFLTEIDRPLESRTWQINYADPEEIAARLEGYIPEEMSPIGLDEEMRQITVTSVPGRLDEIDTLIAQWDIQRRQVEIEAFLVATNATVMRNIGVNWFYTDEKNGNNIAIGSGEDPIDFLGRSSAGQLLQIGAVPFQTPVLQADPANPGAFIPVLDIDDNPIPNLGFGNEGLSVALEYLDQQGDLSILTRPRVVVLDGEEAIFENTEDEPFQESGFLANNNNNNNNNVVPLRVQFITVGTILKVLPRITADNNIQMEISAEESSAETVEIVSGDLVSTIPKKRQSKTETMVIAHDQQTIVIGGLRAQNLEDEVTKVPVLGDIPLLSRLFKSTKKDHRDNELVIFLTPTIVDEYTHPESMRLARADEELNTRMRGSKKTMFERWAEKLSGGSNEISVSIGQSGNIYSEGAMIALGDLIAHFESLERPTGRTVVLRAHPRAPEPLIVELTEQAEAIGLKVERIETALPFVPVTPEEAN